MNAQKGVMTEGKPLPLILKFAYPMLLGAVFQQLYNVIDMLVVGNVNGSRALAAVGATGSTTFFIMALSWGLTGAFTTVISQYYGAGDTASLKKTLSHSIIISSIMAIAMVFIGIFAARPIMELLNTPPEIIDDAVLYIQICVSGSFGMIVYNAVSSILRAVGDSKTPLFFLIISSGLNVGLDFLFVLAFKMGVAGVAYATVLSQVLAGIACAVYMLIRYEVFRLKAIDFRFDGKLMAYILKLGITSGMQSMVLSVGDMFITRAVNNFGADVVAANAACGRIMGITMMFCMTMSQAFTVYAGQNFGALMFDRIREGFRKIVVVIAAMSLVLAAIVFFFGGDLVRLFISSEDAHIESIIDIARGCMRVQSCFYLFLGLIWLYNNTLRGLGDVWVPFSSSMIEIVFKVGLTFALSAMFGYFGIWFANPFAWVLGLIPSVVRFHSGSWHKLADRFKKEPLTE